MEARRSPEAERKRNQEANRKCPDAGSAVPVEQE